MSGWEGMDEVILLINGAKRFQNHGDEKEPGLLFLAVAGRGIDQ